MVCSCISAQNGNIVGSSATESKQEKTGKRVVLIGGTGRLGSSTAQSLSKMWPNISIVLCGRNREKGEELSAKIGSGTRFQPVDVEDIDSVAQALDGADLVVHSAGPFQLRKRCTVLEAAIECKVPYLDVCDDLNHARLAKTFHEKAFEAGVPAIITSGLYPGVANIMAAELVRLQRDSSTGSNPDELRFSYFTAGTGGAGPTILVTSFLLLKEQVLTYEQGKPVKRGPYSSEKIVDFGKGVGKRSTYLVPLPEVTTTHELLGVPTVSARFGTAPFFWNWAMCALAGKEFLNDSTRVISFVKLSDIAVRAIDRFVGATVSIRVDLNSQDGKKAVGVYTHRDLAVSVGLATAAFAAPVLEGKTRPGVWFPEQEEAIPVAYRQELLNQASKGTINFVMNRSPWMVETDPKEIGFGIYLE